MFKPGNMYNIVLKTDLDGNTLPFPPTLVGKCLTADSEYATFLDPITNIVRAMKLRQGTPVSTAPPKPSTPAPPKPSPTPSTAKPATPTKPSAPATAKPATPTKPSAPAAPTKPAAPAKPAAAVPPKSIESTVQLKEDILRLLIRHLRDKRYVFEPPLQKLLITLQSSISPSSRTLVSLTSDDIIQDPRLDSLPSRSILFSTSELLPFKTNHFILFTAILPPEIYESIDPKYVF